MTVLVNVIDFDKNREQRLRKQLEELHSQEAVLSYYQLQGFLFSIACSPEQIRPSEWFDLIWLSDDPQFDDEKDARDFFRTVVALSEHIADMARQRRFLPFSASYSERWLSELSEWCDGMLIGHQYLEDLWLITLDDLDDQTFIEEVDAALGLASTFYEMASDKQLSFDEELALTDDHLPDAYELFWKVLGTYATIGRIWAENTWEMDSEQLFLALESVPKDELCPCGSGLIFAKCCLH